MIAVRDQLDQLGDALPVVITFTTDPARLAAYRDHLSVGFPIVADVDRVLYDVLGAGRGSLRRIWSPGTLLLYARLLRRGHRITTSTEDTRQLGADAVISPDGRLVRVWLPSGPDQRPDLEEIVTTVDLLRSDRRDADET